MKRLLYAWLTILFGIALFGIFGIAMALLSSFVMAHTSRWVGFAVMLVIISLFTTWWMVSTPAWVKRIVLKGFDTAAGGPKR